MSAKNPVRSIPASSIREAVKNRGGQLSSVHFPKEKTVDQVAYIRIMVKIDIGNRLPGFFSRVKLSYALLNQSS